MIVHSQLMQNDMLKGEVHFRNCYSDLCRQKLSVNYTNADCVVRLQIV